MNKYDFRIYYQYEKVIENTNETINSINSNTNDLQTYNFKVSDKHTNKILKSIYTEKFIKYVEKNIITSCEIPKFDFKEHVIKFDLLKPINVEKNEQNIKLNFHLANNSKIFSNIQEDKSSTNFYIIEQLDINKNDYAYVTLLFPNYDSNGNKSYEYLLGCLLLAYLLKTQPQNYDLLSQNKVGTKAKIICMVTPDVENKIINILNIYFDDVIIVPYISWNENCTGITITDISRGNIDSKHSYSKVMTKLNIFNKKIFPYKKIIYIDSDLFPVGYYDSLFSLDTPAGCLEHRRIQKPEFGIDSWGYDRGQFIKHGNKIPSYLTNLIDSIASDVNASLYVIEPDYNMFQEIINELKQPIDKFFNDNPHKGFWLGNKFYNFYYLPEQNYLTQKFSGKWHSIDMGFSTWMVELENCFGFTFAGFVTKPWKYQSVFHNYSINPYSLFSKINNKCSNRSYGMQIFNNYLIKMITFSNYKNILIEYVKDIKFIEIPYDPWEPECNLIKCKQETIINYTYNKINLLSPDQKKLFVLCNEYNKLFYERELNNILYTDYLFEQLTQNIYNLEYIAILYHLYDIFDKIAEETNVKNKLFPFGNTLYALNKYKSFDITDDDNDFVVIIEKAKYKKKLITLIEKLLEKKLQIYFNRGDLNEFIQIIPDNIKPIYYFKENNCNYLSLNEFISNFDNINLKFFNISPYKSQLDNLCRDFNIEITNDMYSTFQRNNYIKHPWIDIFIMIDDKKSNNDIYFPANINFKPEKYLFNSNKIKMKISNKKINNINYNEFNKCYYKNTDRVNNIIIKSRHNNIGKERHIIIKIDENKKIEKHIILFIINTINNYIRTIYKSIDIQKYL